LAREQAAAEKAAAAKAAAEQAAATKAAAEKAAAAAPAKVSKRDLTAARRALARGDAALRKKKVAKAQKEYGIAAKKNPQSVEANYKLGLSFAMANMFAEAAHQFQQVLRLDPNNAGAKANLARARKKAALDRAAKPKAPSLPPELAARQLYKDAVKLITKRKYRDAIIKLDEALRLKHDFALAYVARGSSFVGIADYRRAVAEYKKALTFDTTLSAPYYGLAESYRGLGDRKRALDNYKNYIASNGRDKDPNMRKAAETWVSKLSR